MWNLLPGQNVVNCLAPPEGYLVGITRREISGSPPAPRVAWKSPAVCYLQSDKNFARLQNMRKDADTLYD